MSYFIVMCNHRTGREAIVDPNMSRSNVVDMIASKEWENVLWVHEIHADGSWTDLTSEILEAALPEIHEAPTAADRQAWGFDRAHDLRKHSEVV